jgi:uncharacterized protein (TIGR02145 family)
VSIKKLEMKKLISLLLGITLFYSCSTNTVSNGNSINIVVPGVPGLDISDIEGNLYHTATNCNQTWTTSNLNVSKYRNGDDVPQVTDATLWAGLTTGAWCYFNNDSANGTIYGKLYNWYAVTDPRGLAPTGYHIPTDTEWTTLTTCLGGIGLAGGNMKEIGVTHWAIPNAGATNESSFTALPGGFRYFNAAFSNIGGYGYWWSTSENSTSGAWSRYLNYYNNASNKFDYNKTYGFSVRCLKD